MRLQHFSLGGLRVFAEAEFFPGPGINFITGSNGAGKTSLLEAAFILGQGRSFRAPHIESVLRSGSDVGWAFAELAVDSSQTRRVGVARSRGGGWDVRIDGRRSDRLADLAGVFPVLCFDPGSHAWVSGPADRRRRLLDWGVFHVERPPLSLWSSYQRALRQRNEGLRSGDPNLVEIWEPALVTAGEAIDLARRAFLDRWLPAVKQRLAWLSPGLANLRIDYRRGWGKAHPGLAEALFSHRARDRSLGYTVAGPHRAELALRIEDAEARDRLSRGQSKIVALSMLLAMAEVYGAQGGGLPLLLLDDLESELDPERFERVVAWLGDQGAQCLITGVNGVAKQQNAYPYRVFHVEQGRITPLL